MGSFPFDAMAPGYDAAFTDTPVGRQLRELVWERLDALFAPGEQVLEIGCGTGEDAARLARRGVHVTGTDASPGMIEVARAKLACAAPGGRADLRVVPMENLVREFGGTRFDGVLSNFGAVNCARDLARTVEEVATLVRPGGVLLWVPMGRHVPWEWAWYLARGDWRRARRRYARGGADWRGLRIHYPTPRELTALLAPRFDVTAIRPLGAALPPSYAAGWAETFTRAFDVLARLERRAFRARRLGRALASVADHYLVEAVRRP